ncbi:DUF4350 domain-containing protein [Microlunatus speluncae]|uniref:DUF4350 domain-containing protein n=1 Tax=Microlunatus speluncae TaxID=2594267 RepID=UPI0012665E61|nr:DUF4350 domain-containing protein [Microlunatus speluncae]
MTIFAAPPGPGAGPTGPPADKPEPPAGQGPPPDAPTRPRSRWSSFWRHPATRWVAAILLVTLIIALTITAFGSMTGSNGPNDPRSARPDGAGAGAAVLRQEGVDVRPTRRVDDAVRDGAGATVVVAFPDRLTAAQARRLLAIPDARIILLAPESVLERFGAAAENVLGGGSAEIPMTPQCDDPAALRAGDTQFRGGEVYRPNGALLAGCYPGDGGFGYLRAATAAGPEIELLGGGWTNDEIALAGNAALVTSLFGSRDRLIWLLETTPDSDSTGGGEPTRPTVLPGWWTMAVAQAVVAVIIVGLWRGRRLGPIIQERLPVRVRASETVEGHGRLYFRLSARDRAAAALRDGVVRRLSRRYGHGNDPMALAAALAERTGRDSRQVHQVLFGPVPTDDDQLLDLAENLDQLEQEARQP